MKITAYHGVCDSRTTRIDDDLLLQKKKSFIYYAPFYLYYIDASGFFKSYPNMRFATIYEFLIFRTQYLSLNLDVYAAAIALNLFSATCLNASCSVTVGCDKAP
jgi:hypothetical protein